MAYIEKRTSPIVDNSRIKAKDFYEEKYNHITGETLDYFIYPNGKKELIRHDFNLIVNTCSVLIACLMKGEAGYAGATYWAVGEGSDSWSNTVPPAPLVTDSQLTSETFRKVITPATDIVFLDELNAISATPTGKIQITTTFLQAEANGPLREFAIFGGLADSTANSGFMINHKIHPLIYKTDALELERVLRIQF